MLGLTDFQHSCWIRIVDTNDASLIGRHASAFSPCPKCHQLISVPNSTAADHETSDGGFQSSNQTHNHIEAFEYWKIGSQLTPLCGKWIQSSWHWKHVHRSFLHFRLVERQAQINSVLGLPVRRYIAYTVAMPNSQKWRNRRNFFSFRGPDLQTFLRSS